jgi:formylglycine-generating enzyme required for sulfatase activity
MRNLKVYRGGILVSFAGMVWAAGAPAVQAAITIDTVHVADAGNPADVYTNNYGSVGYDYDIGKYEVTSKQYTAFLNAVAATDTYGLYNPAMSGLIGGHPGIAQSGLSGSYTYSFDPGRGSHPVTDVTFWDAARFANWLSNGQPTGVAEGPGTTETGTYTLTANSIANNTATRDGGGHWAVASSDEWYKAAYYNGSAGTYSYYPTQSNTLTTTQANVYGNPLVDSTPVGSYAYPSYYGTYDQAGNAYELTDEIRYGTERAIRGGSWYTAAYDASVFFNNEVPATNADYFIGFRVSFSSVPEPGSFALISLGATSLLSTRKRNRPGNSK